MTFSQTVESVPHHERYELEERAAIRQYDGGLSQIEAEIQTALDYHKGRWDRMRAATEV